jgi:hypothetical protein
MKRPKVGVDRIRDQERAAARERLKKITDGVSFYPGELVSDDDPPAVSDFDDLPVVSGVNRLISILLRGYLVEFNQCYLEDDSPQDKRARTALAGLLRSGAPLTQDLRITLANLFDPTWHGEARRLKFEYRDAVPPTHTVRNSVIAKFVYEHVKAGGSAASGKRAAALKFGLGEDGIKRIWDRYKPAIEATDGKLPAPRRRRPAK